MAEGEGLIAWREWFESSLTTLLLHMDTLLELLKLAMDCVIGGIIVLSIPFDEGTIPELLENFRADEDGRKKFLLIPRLSAEKRGTEEEVLSRGIRISIVALGLPFIKLLFLFEDNSIG